MLREGKEEKMKKSDLVQESFKKAVLEYRRSIEKTFTSRHGDEPDIMKSPIDQGA